LAAILIPTAKRLKGKDLYSNDAEVLPFLHPSIARLYYKYYTMCYLSLLMGWGEQLVGWGEQLDPFQ
jgi:hypothetical protein